jgi:hypothetical protein
MGGSGKTTTEVKIPAWLEEAAQRNLAKADTLARIGPTPYYGPDVAAMTPMQLAAMQGTNQMAAAFGSPTADPMSGMPTAKDYGGMSAYSSGDMYDQALAELERRMPGQFAALRAPFIDPVTGAQPGSPYGSGSATGGAGASASAGATVSPSRSGGGRDSYGSSRTQPSGTGTGSMGLPDPMSGRITSVGPIGRDGGGGLGGRK